MKAKVFEDSLGNGSSSRVIAMSIVISALIMLFSMIIFCFIHPDMALAMLGVTGGVFTTITTPTFIFLYSQKKQEIKQEEIKDE